MWNLLEIYRLYANGKNFTRFVATVIPEELIRNKHFLNVKIDMTNTSHNIYIREVGTVDLY